MSQYDELLKGKSQKEIQAILNMALEKQKELEAIEPYWFFEPTTGELSEERMAFLKKWVDSKFIPEKIYGQKDVLMSEAKTILDFGGNQGGKTTLTVIRAIIQATGLLPHSLKGVFPESKIPKEFPQRIRIVCEDIINGFEKNVKPALRYWTPKSFLKKGSFDESWSEKERTLTLLNGSTVEVMSDDQEVEKFSGPPRHFTGFDEEPKKDNYEECLLRHSTTGMNMFFSMTPTKGMTWISDELLDKPDTEYFYIPSITNPKIDLKNLDDILEKIKDPDKIRMRLLGSHVALSGLVYPYFDKRLHKIRPFEVLKSKYLVFLGIDAHITTETAVVWMAFGRENVPIVVEEMFLRDTVDRICAEVLRRSSKYRMGWASFDYSANTDVEIYGTNIFQDFQKNLKGIWCRLAPKGAGSVNYGVNEIGELLRVDKITGKPNFFIFDSCPMTINDFRTLDRDTYRNEDVKGQKDKIREGKRHRHACVRYVMQLAPRWIEPIESVPVYVPDNYVVAY